MAIQVKREYVAVDAGTTGVSAVPATNSEGVEIQTTKVTDDRRDGRIRNKVKTKIITETKNVEKIRASILERREKLIKLDSDVRVKIKNLDDWQVRRLTGVSDETLKKLIVFGENEIKGLSMLTKEEIKVLAREDPKKIKTLILEKVKEKQVLRANDFKRRIVTKDDVIKFEQKFKVAKDKYVKAKEIYLAKKNELVKLNKELKLCDGVETEECNQLRAEVLEHAKEYLLNAGTSAIGVLEKMQAKLESSEDLESAKAAEMVEKIEAKIQEIEALQEKVNNTETKEELKIVANELKSVLVSVKNQVRYNAERVKVARVGLIVERAEHLELRLNAILTNMETQNLSVEDIDSKVVEFTDKIALARQNYELAKTAFESAKDSDTPGQIVKESNVYVKEAQSELKSAHKVLVEILKIVKDNGGNLSEGAEIDDDVNDVDTSEIPQIEVEIENGVSKVETEINGTKNEFTLETIVESEIIAEIASRTGLSIEDVEKYVEFKINKIDEDEIEEEEEELENETELENDTDENENDTNIDVELSNDDELDDSNSTDDSESDSSINEIESDTSENETSTNTTD